MRLDREEYKAAASALEIAHRLEGAKKGDWLELSELYLYLNAPLMAIRCMEYAYPGKMPGDRMAKIASTYARTQRFDKAMEIIEDALEQGPSADLYFEKGRLLYDAMRYEEAIVALEQCSKMDPKHGQAYILAGFAAWNMKQWEQARSAFVKASVLPKFRDQANDAVGVLDDLMTAMAEQGKSDF
jgi:tetratricopeptide (TPR) repeat protein